MNKQRLQCILCKYKDSPTACKMALERETWHCPTLSNIYYGKLINYFPFKIIHNIGRYFEKKNASRYYETFNDNYTENENVKFIFGVKAYDDLSCGSDANLLTMNDLDVIYNKKNKTYSWSVEYIYAFDNINGKKRYLKHLLYVFTKFMNDNDYNTNYDGFCGMFSNCTEFDTLEECYANFKYCVNGYINS